MKAYSGPAAADFKPDANQILTQLAFWFGEQVTGEIDIGWHDPKTGELNRSRRFDVGDIDECSAFIAEVNRTPGQSVYFRPALVRLDAPRHVPTSISSPPRAPGPTLMQKGPPTPPRISTPFADLTWL